MKQATTKKQGMPKLMSNKSYTPTELEIERGYTRLGSKEYHEKHGKRTVRTAIEEQIAVNGFCVKDNIMRMCGVSRQAVEEVVKRNSDQWTCIRVWRYYDNVWVDHIIHPREINPSQIKRLIKERYGFIIP